MTFRTLTVLAAASSVVLTWAVWQPRELPPHLPLLPLPSLPIGPLLLAALALCLVRPAAGMAGYWVVLAYAVLADQLRLQPQFISFGLLLAAGLPGAAGVTLARVHLVTLWFYAGLHKLLSPDFLQRSPEWMLGADAPGWLQQAAPWSVIASEVGLAVLALVPRTRRLAVAVAFLLHGGILLGLVHDDWNPSVWPWNALLAVAGIFLILPWTTTLGRDLRVLRLPARALAIVLLVYPLGFYVGAVDTYLAHCLYAMNEPRGYVCHLSGDPQPRRPGLGSETEYRHMDGPFQCRAIFTTTDLGTPFPPAQRLFEQYFQRTCDVDEFLLVLERRWVYTRRGLDQQIVRCPVDAAPR